MRLSEMTGKEVINISDGARMGVIEECDLGFDARTGRIEALLLPGRGGLLQIFGDSKGAAIPWSSIRRIGDEVIITDMSEAEDWEAIGKRQYRRND
ncbi:MAG: YlmC/YmxH family sporulation protein [Sporomusaceae bacterium]|nr:YlmC/YmxH family sporulation protein [Sporomusaceae bacterium]